jgi:hypothetical protein
MPEVLEGSKRRLSDVKQFAKNITGAGILVKLFLVDDSNRTLWIVGSPNAIYWTLSKLKDVHKANAKAKAGSASRPRVEAKVRNVAEQPVQKGQSELYDTSDEQEGEKEDDTEEDDTGENDAGEGVVREDVEENLNDSEEEEDLEQEEEAAVSDKNEHDTEEQDGDEYNRASEEAEVEKADKRENEEHESKEDLEEDIGEKEEFRAEGQQEAVREGEREREEKMGGETDPHSEIRGKDCAVHNGEEGEHRGDGRAGKEQGDQNQVQRVENAVGLQTITSNRYGTWEMGDINGEASHTNSDEEETTARDENGGAEARRKRAFEGDEAMDNSLPEERPNKRSKSEQGENEDDTAIETSFERGLETPPRPRTPSPTSSTPSLGSTIKIVRQTSVMPRLEDTESAV